MRGIFLVWEMSIFFAAGRDSPPIYRISPQTVGLQKGVGQSIHGGSNNQDELRGKIFGKMGNTGDIILLDTVLYQGF